MLDGGSITVGPMIVVLACLSITPISPLMKHFTKRTVPDYPKIKLAPSLCTYHSFKLSSW